MVNIHEALQKAKKEQQARRKQMDEPEHPFETDLTPEPAEQDREIAPVEHPAELEPVSHIHSRVISYFDPGSLAAEQFRSIRTALSSMGEESVKSMVITSASRGEGKTTVTANLGAVLASDLHQRVLVIDGDLRKPSLARILGVPSQPGLTDVLQGNVGRSLEALEREVIRPTELERLDVLPSGTPTLNPTELLGSRDMKELLDLLKEKYSRILIDSPPIIAVTDASVIGNLTEGAILVIQAGKTRREVVMRAVTLLPAARNNILGCILNGIEYHIPSYIYRYI